MEGIVRMYAKIGPFHLEIRPILNSLKKNPPLSRRIVVVYTGFEPVTPSM